MLRRQLATPTVGNERVFACIVAGTTGGSEPTWVVTKGAKTTDNTVTWQECTGQPGVNGDITNCPTWLQNKNTAVSLGLIISNDAQTFLFIVTTAGTTGNGSEPSWNYAAGGTTTDNTVTWTLLGAVAAYGSWAAPHARLANAFATNWSTAGNTIFVGDDHDETQAAEIYLQGPGTPAAPCYVYCIDHTVSLPPGSGNLKTTAVVNGPGTIALYGFWAVYGVIFQSNNLSTSFTINNNGAGTMRFDDCSFQMTASTGNTHFEIGGGSGLCQVLLNNTTVSFGSSGQLIACNNVRLTWKNTQNAVQGVAPLRLFSYTSVACTIVLDGLDLSALTTVIVDSNQNAPLNVTLTDCKLAAGVTVAASPILSGGAAVDVIRSDSAATIYQAQRYNYFGQQVPSIIVVRTGGASDGTTSVSYSITTSANALWDFPYEAFPIAIWNPVTGSTVTCTVHGIWNAAALPNNDQVWLDVEYLGSASSPLASFATGSKANNLATGTALAADTSAWDSEATARANSTAYSVGATIKLASNPGRLFWCTTAGTSAGSEPAGYATAVDGGSVTDGTAAFRAGVRFAMIVPLSSPAPALAGDLYGIVRAALPSSTWYVDPLIVLS